MSNDPIIEAVHNARSALSAAVQLADKRASTVTGGVFIPETCYAQVRQALAACNDASEDLRASLVPAWGAIERTPVQSSNVASVGYHLVSQTLEVAFKNGGVYRYFGVSFAQHRALMEAESVGRFLNEHIKPAHDFVKQPMSEVA